MIAATVQINDAEFQDMLRRYVSVSSQSVADSINKKMGDVMLTAARVAPKADRQSIDQLYTKPWWYKFVQTVLNFEGVKETTRRRVKKSEGSRIGRSGSFEERKIWRDPISGQISGTRRTKGISKLYAGGQSRKNIGRVSRIITRRRRAGVAYFKALFIATSQIFGKYTRAVRDGKLDSFGFDADSKGKNNATRGISFTAATATSPAAIAGIPMRTSRKGDWPNGTRPSPNVDLQMKSGIAKFAIQTAMQIQVRDMAQYIGRKLIEGARQSGFKVAA